MNEPFNLSYIFSEGFVKQKIKSTTCDFFQRMFTNKTYTTQICHQSEDSAANSTFL